MEEKDLTYIRFLVAYSLEVNTFNDCMDTCSKILCFVYSLSDDDKKYVLNDISQLIRDKIKDNKINEDWWYNILHYWELSKVKGLKRLK